MESNLSITFKNLVYAHPEGNLLWGIADGLGKYSPSSIHFREGSDCQYLKLVESIRLDNFPALSFQPDAWKEKRLFYNVRGKSHVLETTISPSFGVKSFLTRYK